MTISLCEQCFPYDGTLEILTIPPGLTPCEMCQRYDDRRNSGLRVNTFRSDPRKPAKPNYRGLNIPFINFGGGVTTDSLFCENEQIIFEFYAKNKDRYRRALDIGANIGVHSILMARQGWDVHAYEPDYGDGPWPDGHYDHLEMNIKTNGVKSNVLPFNVAVSDQKGVKIFVRVKGNTTGSHLKGDKQTYGELEEFDVPVVDCRPLFDWADFAKIDCEGHEARILLTVTPAQAERVDFMVEVGSKKNAELIYVHFAKLPTKLWSQKNDWQPVKNFEDMPIHHSEGSLFIGREAPWPKNP